MHELAGVNFTSKTYPSTGKKSIEICWRPKFSENITIVKSFSAKVFKHPVLEEWHHRKLDIFRLILRVSSALSNKNLVPVDYGSRQLHAPFTCPTPPVELGEALTNIRHSWFPVSNSPAGPVPQVFDGALATNSAMED